MVKRYQRGNKKQYIKEGHSIQWSKDTKEIIGNSTSKKDIQYNGQKITKEVIRNSTSKKDIQYNGQQISKR